MKIDYFPQALEALEDAPAQVRKAFFKQVKFLEQNLQHASLRAKKYDESQDLWQQGLALLLQHRRRSLRYSRYCPSPQMTGNQEVKLVHGRSGAMRSA